QEASSHHTNGVFILITRTPGHVQIGVGNQTQRKVFTLKDKDELQQLLVESFKQHDFDGGLLKGAKFVRDRMRQHVLEDTAPDETVAATRPAGDERDPRQARNSKEELEQEPQVVPDRPLRDGDSATKSNGDREEKSDGTKE